MRFSLLSSFMSRPLRLERPGAIWHVTSRGNERRNIHRSDSDRLFFVQLLGHVVVLHDWILHAWVLMSNHYHLLVETPLPNLSHGVKRLNEIYAQTFNDRHHRVGHLFQGRFKGIHVERETHLLELVRYLVLNPVRCCAVKYPGDYRWSSYRATAGLAPVPQWLAVDWTRTRFSSGSRSDLCEAYRRFVADGRGASYKPWESLVGQIYLGSEAFCQNLQALVNTKPRSREHPESQRIFVRPSLDAVIDLVAQFFEQPIESLRQRSHGAGRKALAQLAWEEAGLSLAAIGNWMNLTERAVSYLVCRGNQLENGDHDYADRIRNIRQHLETPHSPF